MNPDADLPLLRLLQLVSPSLPVGGFTYSQGIEWAAEAGWVRDADSLEAWLRDLLRDSLGRVDLPVLARLYRACLVDDPDQLRYWSDVLIACRETAELRAEEANRGRALADLLIALEVPRAAPWREVLATTQAAGYALAAAHWDVTPRAAALGYVWSWLENGVLAAVKIIPLGQTAGQRLLQRLSAEVPAAVDAALGLGDEEIGASAPALAIASSRHETQYTRLFRS